MSIRKIFFLVVAFTVLSGSIASFASGQDMKDQNRHRAAIKTDSRQAVYFPAKMQKHILADMRDHLRALSEILTAMSVGEYTNAAHIARARLGLNSPSAAGCTGSGASVHACTAPSADMVRMMERFMPKGMRKMGRAMHKSASAFAAVAAQTEKSGDAKKAYAALARVTRHCMACHAVYKMR